jgi:predicted amino acid-binding ACT domain protein
LFTVRKSGLLIYVSQATTDNFFSVLVFVCCDCEHKYSCQVVKKVAVPKTKNGVTIELT